MSRWKAAEAQNPTLPLGSSAGTEANAPRWDAHLQPCVAAMRLNWSDPHVLEPRQIMSPSWSLGTVNNLATCSIGSSTARAAGAAGNAAAWLLLSLATPSSLLKTTSSMSAPFGCKSECLSQNKHERRHALSLASGDQNVVPTCLCPSVPAHMVRDRVLVDSARCRNTFWPACPDTTLPAVPRLRLRRAPAFA